uniref:Transmembrane protein 120B n=1 Tax=Romanomermis culicivorax TaxID=13658 RepID=A0A915JIT1_ROMCU
MRYDHFLFPYFQVLKMDGSSILSEWTKLEADFENLEANHTEYLTLLAKLNKVQQEASSRIRNYSRKLTDFKNKAKKYSIKNHEENDEVIMQIRDILAEMSEKKTKLDDMTEELPCTNNGLYLNIILGHLNVSLTNKADKFRYKDEYEKFKMVVTFFCMIFASFALCFHFRVLDAAFHFLLVWYYCTLTIRESILRCNGSRIKGWWVAHHYFSAILCGVLLTWPDTSCYQSFRIQFLLFSLYLSTENSVVQLIQCQYQRGCLYRLKSLGDSHSMAITIDGFHMWMFRGLTFVLPFLIFGYLAQLYNAYTLYYIWLQPACTNQWQVIVACMLFLFLSIGNTVTTIQVCVRKWRETKKITHTQRLRSKYSIDVRDSGLLEIEKSKDN